MDYQLVDATKNDKEMLTKFKLASILDYANDLNDDEITKIKDYVETNLPKQLNQYKIIMANEKKIGCVLVTDYKDGVLLDEIYLVSEFRGKGIGTNIISNVLKNHKKVYLWVYKNNENAIKLYEKLGFKIKDTTDSRIFMES